ncbi:type II toxin-antitoxin system death-on-curing family toxin [Rhodohalobacter sp.]|uniref:type II toxin-antitoxin system death-on-curing family toxin n=1 Tax=Rhodohalobacter sp. TaxID=1974210 RepID=UPI002ACE8CAB|nr:type II toxin-antitoxin system death-on-curing family toxin [Rhodohalobacter sp.]MDZ7757693.1 type II toxin-antitoxin system death-on-curing family toxin [Rhodohalobacter sp.]
MSEPIFLTLENILSFHNQEIKIAGGATGIRDSDGVEACVDAPKVSFGGEYLLDLFSMAATYISCITMRHPFVDGNKRTALASALTFLYLNGYVIEETYDEELADIVLGFISKDITKDDVASHLKEHSVKRFQ